jgi:hypothetical protein
VLLGQAAQAEKHKSIPDKAGTICVDQNKRYI